MSDDKRPTAKAEPRAVPRLVSIRFPGALTLTGISPVEGISIGYERNQWPPEGVLVTERSVFLRAANSDTVVEVARSACVLRWAGEGASLADIVSAVR